MYYAKRKYEKKKKKLCFVVYIKTDEIYKDIVEDAETKFDTSNYELEYWIMNYEYFLPNGKNKKKLDYER